MQVRLGHTPPAKPPCDVSCRALAAHAEEDIDEDGLLAVIVCELMQPVRTETARACAEMADKTKEQWQRTDDRLTKQAQERYVTGGRSVAVELERQAKQAEQTAVAMADHASAIRARFLGGEEG